MVDKKNNAKNELALEVFEKLNKLITAGFGLVAALAWNDVIKSFFQVYYPQPEDGLLAQVFYALLVTLIVVVVTVYIARYTNKLKKSLGIVSDKKNED